MVYSTDRHKDKLVLFFTQVHLSFSLYGAENAGDGAKSPQLQWQFLRLFLQSVGIVLTDIQDVVFKYVRCPPDGLQLFNWADIFCINFLVL